MLSLNKKHNIGIRVVGMISVVEDTLYRYRFVRFVCCFFFPPVKIICSQCK